MTIGRPVVKNAKETAKAAAVVAGARPRAGATSVSGMPIIGRPVVTPAVPPTKLAKVPGMGDSPQPANQMQQQQQGGGQPVAGQPGQTAGQQAMMQQQIGAGAGRIGGGSGNATTLQVWCGPGSCF